MPSDPTTTNPPPRTPPAPAPTTAATPATVAPTTPAPVIDRVTIRGVIPPGEVEAIIRGVVGGVMTVDRITVEVTIVAVTERGILVRWVVEVITREGRGEGVRTAVEEVEVPIRHIRGCIPSLLGT